MHGRQEIMPGVGGAVSETAAMVFGVDARAAAEEPAGRGRVLRELLSALAARDDRHRYLLYCRRPWDGAPLDERFRWVPIGLPDPAWHAVAALRANRGCHAFLSTNSYLTAWMLRVPCVVVVYDMVAFLPQTHAQKRAARIERATIRPAIHRAERLVCISRSTEKDLLRLFRPADGKTTVVPLAADRRFQRQRTSAEVERTAARYGVTAGSYVLSAGTLEPRKNLLRLIRAHGALPPELRGDYPLVIVGPRGWEEQQIIRAAADAEAVRLTGFVTDDDLAALYAGCTVFCYPSLYEGFGLPVLEAMASGAAVITSHVSSLPEVGGDAVEYVDPADEGSIAAILERLLRSWDERDRLARAAKQRAETFSWDRVAQALLHELEGAADRRR
jgi:glycosyltransferase involved in cell wall biosynthesis